MDLQRFPLITRRQMEAIAKSPRADFECEVALRARRFFPRLTGSLSDQELGRRIRGAVSHAMGVGIKAKCDLARHAYLTLVLGAGFEARFAWAGRIHGSGGPAALRHRRLYCEAIDRLRHGLDPWAKEAALDDQEPDDGG